MLAETDMDGARAPGDAAELAALIAEAARAKRPVWPIGSGTAFHDGAPRADGLVVKTAGLAAIVDHQPDDLTITVQAGATLSAVQAQLATARQVLPHRPAGGGRATIGGLLATHRPGLTRLGHGPLRDRVLGMTVALSTGELARSGGRVVKNVAGYDLHRLHVGARGTLGVIVEVTLKVLPLPPGRTLLMMPLASMAAAGPLARGIAGSALVPVAVLASERLDGRGPGGEDLMQPWLWVLFEDVDAGREQAVRACAARAREAGVAEAVRHDGVELPELLAEPGARAQTMMQLMVPGSYAGRLAEGARGGALVADLGEGIVRCAVEPRAAEVTRRASLARELGGWARVERAPASVWAELAQAPRARGNADAQMEALRAALDPAGVMCPGRLFEGVL